MALQIAHEAEIHRQHVRLRIPITIEVDGTRFTADDWSMGGFGVTGELVSRQPGEYFPVRLWFPFEDFQLALRLDCQMVYLAEDRSRFGCRFTALSAGQITLFRYLIDAYLSGELVSAGDILALAGRDNSAEARGQPLNLAPFAEEEALGRRLRRWAGLALFALAGVGLLLFVAYGVRERYLTVPAETAFVDAPRFMVRAPLSGLLRPAAADGILPRGHELGRIEALAGSSGGLTSPCVCVVQSWLVEPDQYVQEGEPVAVLVAADRPLTIRAQLPLERAVRLQPGAVAEFVHPDSGATAYGQIERIDARAPALPGGVPAGRATATVIVRPDAPLDFDTLGALVLLRFR